LPAGSRIARGGSAEASLGPHLAIGGQFALTEAPLVLATMIQAFRIEQSDDTPVISRAVVTPQPDHPPPLRRRPQVGRKIKT